MTKSRLGELLFHHCNALITYETGLFFINYLAPFAIYVAGRSARPYLVDLWSQALDPKYPGKQLPQSSVRRRKRIPFLVALVLLTVGTLLNIGMLKQRQVIKNMEECYGQIGQTEPLISSSEVQDSQQTGEAISEFNNAVDVAGLYSGAFEVNEVLRHIVVKVVAMGRPREHCSTLKYQIRSGVLSLRGTGEYCADQQLIILEHLGPLDIHKNQDGSLALLSSNDEIWGYLVKKEANRVQ